MELTQEQALQKGIEAHRAGQVAEADQYYTAILKANPKHPDANHNMGVLAVSVGKADKALPFFKKALEANQSIAQYWLSYINALIKLDRVVDAKVVLDQAKKKGAKGNSFDKLEIKLANAIQIDEDQTDEKILCQAVELHTNGKYDKAIDLLLHQIKKSPKNPNIPALLCRCYISIENLEHAAIYLGIAKDINPNIAKIGWNETRILLKQQRTSEALTVVKKTHASFPNDIEGLVLFGACLRINGDTNESLNLLNNAIELNPNHAEALINRGLIYLNQHDTASALNDLEKAHYLSPHLKLIWHPVLNLKMAVNDFENTIAIATEMAKLDPLDAKVIAAIALCYQGQKNYHMAAKFYNKALNLEPKFFTAWINLGATLIEQDKLEEAIEAFHKALTIKPDCEEAYYNMGLALHSMTFDKPNKNIQKEIFSLLEKGRYVRPSDIAKSAISLLKLEPTLQKHLKLLDGFTIENLKDAITDLNELPLLLKLMSICPLPDLEIEKLLSNLRYFILSNLPALKQATPTLLAVQSALALHCFTNEYIYNTTKAEEEMLEALEASVKKGFEINEQPSPQVILILASYKALNEYDWHKFLVSTDKFQEVFVRQIEELNQEKKLRNDIPVLDQITNRISSEVREQYEKRPYPRWIHSALTLQPMSISKVTSTLNLRLHNSRITEIENPEILIAGCGTGQHSIGTAVRFKSSKVLAIDLSLSSLAYAKRKTAELCIKNIDYMQADILDLKQLNKQFDIIESVGVLHHMDDPMSGWRVLTDCLKTGGLMKIGLYSEIARQNIVKIREEISELGIVWGDNEMKAYRDTIIESSEDHHKQILAFRDFYSLSSLKDLLFHVQEHRYTLPDIVDHLDKLGLKFCGFEPNKVVSHFAEIHKTKGDLYDLDKWHLYEQAYPRAFTGMYQFWCQKC